MRDAIEFAALNCTVNERPVYAMLRRSLIALSNYQSTGPSYPPEVIAPLPYDPPESERY